MSGVNTVQNASIILNGICVELKSKYNLEQRVVGRGGIM